MARYNHRTVLVFRIVTTDEHLISAIGSWLRWNEAARRSRWIGK